MPVVLRVSLPGEPGWQQDGLTVAAVPACRLWEDLPQRGAQWLPLDAWGQVLEKAGRLTVVAGLVTETGRLKVARVSYSGEQPSTTDIGFFERE